jgi:adenylate cyclase
MSGQSASGIKRPLYIFAILAISLAVTGLFFASGAIRYWDKDLYDLCIDYRVKNQLETKNPLVTTIVLNDESIEKLGEKLDSRQAFADLFKVLEEYDRSTVALDFSFVNKKSNDDDFANAVKQHSKYNTTVTAVKAVELELVGKPYKELSESEKSNFARHVWHINVLEKGKVPEAGTFLLPFPALLEAAEQVAFINMKPDSDGIYRRVPLLYEWKDGDGYIPSLPLAAAVKHLRIPVETIELKAGDYLALLRPKQETIRIPIDEQGRMLIPYTEAENTNRIPFNEVESKHKKDELGLNNYIALIAEVSSDQNDIGPTSFDEIYPLSSIHAEVISGILNKDYGKERAFIGLASLQYKIIILVLLLGIAFFFINIKKDALFHVGFLLALLALSGVTLLRWGSFAIVPWFAFPVTMLFFIWLCAFLFRLFVRYREQLLLHNALSRYFPHALADRIMREGKTDLIPAYKELTILFSDISGFTKWSSDKSPDQVHNFLSDYLESMAEILFAHGGTVDKFMGDGILSFFGDPLDLPDHTERCLRAAIAMQKKVRILAEKWKPIVDIDLKVRVGINTGKVIVGNLGNKTRIEYTVIGAAVNLAQRMESNAPVGGILVTADAWEKVKDKFTFVEKRDVTVKGYGETIEAYVVKTENSEG